LPWKPVFLFTPQELHTTMETRNGFFGAGVALALVLAAPAAQAAVLAEGFEDVAALPGSGWFFQNNSNPGPLPEFAPATWSQGNTNFLVAQSGSPNSFAGVGVTSTAGDSSGANGTISNWLVTPELDFSQGGSLSFFTRTIAGNSFAEFLEVRLSTNGASTDVGTNATDVGDFTTLLLTVGDLNDANAYPGKLDNAWAQFAVSASGLSGTGRIAFRYFATDGGPNGVTGIYIGLDTLTSNLEVVPEPSALAGTLALGSLGMSLRRRRRRTG
jgi:hypothetical protein